MSDETPGDQDVVSPNGWAIIGACIGVLIGYYIGIDLEFQAQILAIAASGTVFAILSHVVEYIYLKRTNHNAINPDVTLPNKEATTDSDISEAFSQIGSLGHEGDSILMISSDSGQISIYDPETGAIGVGETKRSAIRDFTEALKILEESQEEEESEDIELKQPPYFNGGEKSTI
jgi:hypothetical protein